MPENREYLCIKPMPSPSIYGFLGYEHGCRCIVAAWVVVADELRNLFIVLDHCFSETGNRQQYVTPPAAGLLSNPDLYEPERW